MKLFFWKYILRGQIWSENFPNFFNSLRSNWFNRRRHEEKKKKAEAVNKREIINFLDTVQATSGCPPATIDQMRTSLLNNPVHWPHFVKQKSKTVHDVLRQQILQRNLPKTPTAGNPICKNFGENRKKLPNIEVFRPNLESIDENGNFWKFKISLFF